MKPVALRIHKIIARGGEVRIAEIGLVKSAIAEIAIFKDAVGKFCVYERGVAKRAAYEFVFREVH